MKYRYPVNTCDYADVPRKQYKTKKTAINENSGSLLSRLQSKEVSRDLQFRRGHELWDLQTCANVIGRREQFCDP